MDLTTSAVILLLLIFSIIIMLSQLSKKWELAPLWFAFYFYFFKPFFSRLLYYLDDLDPNIVKFDTLSTAGALLIPLTTIFYIIKKKNVLKLLVKSTIFKVLLVFLLIYFIQIFNPKTNLAAGFLSFKNITFIFCSFIIPFIMKEYNYPYHRFISLLLVFSIAYIAYGLIQALGGHNFFDEYYFTYRIGYSHYHASMFMDGKARPFSFATADGNFLYTMVAVFLFILPQYKNINKTNLVLFRIFFILYFLLFIVVPERTPILMTIIGISAVFLLKNKGNYINIIIFILLSLFLIVLLRYFAKPLLLTINSLYLIRLIEVLYITQAETWVTRVGEGGNWGMAYKGIEDNFFFGSGAGTGTFSRAGGELDTFVATHNEYLSILLETGILGFTVFIALIIIVVRELIVQTKANNQSIYDKIRIGIFASLLALMATAFVNFSLTLGEPSRLLWLFIGFIPILFAVPTSKIKRTWFHV